MLGELLLCNINLGYESLFPYFRILATRQKDMFMDHEQSTK